MIEGIDHTRAKARSPQTNGICERFHRTMQNEFYAIGFRKKIYSLLEDLQEDVNKWLEEYNGERSYTGKYCYGKTSLQTFVEAKHLARESKNHYQEKIEIKPCLLQIMGFSALLPTLNAVSPLGQEL